jgi:hypothetical protein
VFTLSLRPSLSSCPQGPVPLGHLWLAPFLLLFYISLSEEQSLYSKAPFWREAMSFSMSCFLTMTEHQWAGYQMQVLCSPEWTCTSHSLPPEIGLQAQLSGDTCHATCSSQQNFCIINSPSCPCSVVAVDMT